MERHFDLYQGGKGKKEKTRKRTDVRDFPPLVEEGKEGGGQSEKTF